MHYDPQHHTEHWPFFKGYSAATPTQTDIVIPLVDVTLLHALNATLESTAGHTLAGPRPPAAPLAQRVTNTPLFL